MELTKARCLCLLPPKHKWDLFELLNSSVPNETEYDGNVMWFTRSAIKQQNTVSLECCQREAIENRVFSSHAHFSPTIYSRNYRFISNKGKRINVNNASDNLGKKSQKLFCPELGIFQFIHFFFRVIDVTKLFYEYIKWCFEKYWDMHYGAE